MMREQNTLQDMYPEVYDLIGVAQPEQWHPEGDAYEHTMLVLEQASKRYLGNDAVLLGALCHDLGKARTPQHLWPKHYGHAALGIPLVGRTLDRLRTLGRLYISEDIIKEVEILTEYHMHIHLADKMKASTYKRIYDDIHSRVGYDRVVEVIINLARLGVCDHFGRGNVDPNERYILPWIFMEKMLEIHNANS